MLIACPLPRLRRASSVRRPRVVKIRQRIRLDVCCIEMVTCNVDTVDTTNTPALITHDNSVAFYLATYMARDERAMYVRGPRHVHIQFTFPTFIDVD